MGPPLLPAQALKMRDHLMGVVDDSKKQWELQASAGAVGAVGAVGERAAAGMRAHAAPLTPLSRPSASPNPFRRTPCPPLCARSCRRCRRSWGATWRRRRSGTSCW
jgi:hypothetical protein